MAPLLLVLSVLLGHEVPPVHLSGVLTPSSGTRGRAEIDLPKARVISTLWRQVFLLFPKTVSITPICTMGDRDILEVWGTLPRSELLPLPSKLRCCHSVSDMEFCCIEKVRSEDPFVLNASEAFWIREYDAINRGLNVQD